MSDRRFDIIFSGKLTSGAVETEVRSNLAALFKIDQQTVDTLFSGEPVIIKKNVDRATAAQYQQALTRAGAIIQLARHGGPPTRSASDSNAQKSAATALQSDRHAEPRSNQPQTSNTAMSLLPVGSLLGEARPDSVTRHHIDTSHLSTEATKRNPFLTNDDFIDDDFISEAVSDASRDVHNSGSYAPSYPQLAVSVGSGDFTLQSLEQELVLPDENVLHATVDVNTSHLESLANYDKILTSEEQMSLTAIAPATNRDYHFELSDAGESLLKTDERILVEPVSIDTSHLALD